MEYRKVGRTGLTVSRLLFGGAHIGEILDLDQTQALVHAAWDAGITTFYTSDKYNNGRAEQILGEAIKARRDDLVLVVKTGYRTGTDEVPVSDVERMATHGEGGYTIDHADMWRKGVSPNSRGHSRKHIMDAVEASLRRLQVDYIDLYETHFWDPFTPIEETLSALTDLVRHGKIRYIGCSQTAAWQMYQALWTSDVKALSSYQSWQIRFNLFDTAERAEQLAAAAAAGISLFAFQSLAGGVLSGDYDRRSPIPDGLGHRRSYLEMYWKERNFDVVDRLRPIAASSGRTVGELSQAWALAQWPVTALQIGPNTVEEMTPQVRAAVNPLTRDEAAAVDQVLAEFPSMPSGPLRFAGR